MLQASPKKLRDGSWGALVRGNAHLGDKVHVVTRAGKSWDAVIAHVLWSGSGTSICATKRGGGRGDSVGNRISNGDSYRAGVTAPRGRRCPECGDRECAKAWDRHALCDED